ncbi:rCG62028, partial [Rattus norvegicus]
MTISYNKAAFHGLP